MLKSDWFCTVPRSRVIGRAHYRFVGAFVCGELHALLFVVFNGSSLVRLYKGRLTSVFFLRGAERRWRGTFSKDKALTVGTRQRMPG